MAAQPPPYPQDAYTPQGQPGYPPSAGQPGYAPTSSYEQKAAYPPQPGYVQPPPGPTPATVVITQPAPLTVVTQPAGIKPNNYLALSIFNLLCCWFLLGIIALIFSLMVDSSWSAGRYNEARSHANIAKILNIIGIVVGSVSWVGVAIGIIYRIVIAIIAATTAATAISSVTG